MSTLDPNGQLVKALYGDKIYYLAGSPTDIGFELLGSTVNTAQTSSISVSGLPARNHYVICVHIMDTGGAPMNATVIRFNNDSGNNYGYSVVKTPATGTSTSNDSGILLISSGASNNSLSLTCIMHVFNQKTRVKMGHWTATNQNEALNNATAPLGVQGLFKWADISSDINEVDLVETGGNNYFGVGAYVAVYGSIDTDSQNLKTVTFTDGILYSEA